MQSMDKISWKIDTDINSKAYTHTFTSCVVERIAHDVQLLLSQDSIRFGRRYFMTNMSAEYSKMLETQRHNKEQERIAAQEAAATVRNAQTRVAELEETKRHQVAQEFLSKYATDADNASKLQAAKLSADASKFGTRMSALSAKLKMANDKEIAQLNNEMRDRIATADRLVNQFIATENQRLSKIKNEQDYRIARDNATLRAREIANNYEIAWKQISTQQQKIMGDTLGSLVGSLSRLFTGFGSKALSSPTDVTPSQSSNANQSFGKGSVDTNPSYTKKISGG